MTPPTRTTKMEFTTVEGGVIDLPVSVEGDRVTRTLGLGGDTLVVLVPATHWPLPNGPTTGGGVDFKKPCTLKFGDVPSSGPPEIIRLEHYYIRMVDPAVLAAPEPDSVVGVPGVVVPLVVRIRLVTLPGYLRADGRGGRIRERTINPLLSGGEVDPDHADYKLNSELVNICVSAMGLTIETTPVSLDETPPPGALDWGNRPPVHELEAILDRCGHAIALPNSGDVCRVIELPKFADTVTLDPEITAALASPLVLAKGPSLRGDLIVVTSGDTKTTVLTQRDLSALEWVCYHEPGRAWLNDIEVEALTPPLDDITPDDFAQWKAGPDPVDRERAGRYARLLKALRLTGDDEGLRLIQAWEPMTFTKVPPPDPESTEPTTFTMGSMAAWARGRCIRPVADNLYVSVHAEDGGPTDIGPVEVHSEAGVFIMPEGFAFAFPVADVEEPFARAQTQALTSTDLRVYFAHEAAFTEEHATGFGGTFEGEGAYPLNYFVTAFRVTRTGSGESATLTLTGLFGIELREAYEDPTAVFLDAPELRRVLRFYPGDETPTEINRAELEERAEAIARTRASLSMAESGVALCAGWLDKAPGCCGGACASVTWDLANKATAFLLNDHETPGGELDRRATLANRSFASGVIGWTLPGGAAAKSDVKTRGTPGISTTPTGLAAGGGGGSGGGTAGNDAENASASRGGEKIVRPGKPSAQLPGGSMAAARFEPVLAKITASTSAGGNRFKYQFLQAVPVIAGAEAGTLSSVVGGISSATHGDAYNLAEASNDGSGVEGNGINVANLPAGWGIQAIPVGAVVRIEMCIADSEGNKACFFYRENTVDGACPSSGGAGGGGGETGLRPSTEGVLAALDMVLTDAAGNVLLDANGEVLLDGDSVGLSLSDLTALTSLLLDGSGPGAAFLNDAHGHLLIGDAGSLVAAGSEQLIDRVLTCADGQPLTDDAGRLLASA